MVTVGSEYKCGDCNLVNMQKMVAEGCVSGWLVGGRVAASE